MLLIIIFIFAQPNEGCTGKKGFQIDSIVSVNEMINFCFFETRSSFEIKKNYIPEFGEWKNYSQK